MATWAATGGSEIGREAFAKWSAKASKNNPNVTEARWQHYKTSPPTRIGFGALVYLARQHSPGWSYGGAEAKSGEASARDGAQTKVDPSALQPDDFYAYMPSHSYIFIASGESGPRAVSIPASRMCRCCAATGRKSRTSTATQNSSSQAVGSIRTVQSS